MQKWHFSSSKKKKTTSKPAVALFDLVNSGRGIDMQV